VKPEVEADVVLVEVEVVAVDGPKADDEVLEGSVRPEK